MLNRRRFMGAAAAATFAAPAFVRGQNLNSKLQIGGIGCGGKGLSDIREIASHKDSKFVGFCDVDLSRVSDAQKVNPEAPVFQDYRDMLSELGDTLDAVTVSTPDHMHAYIGLDAMRQGKHIYCQKPLTHNVWEARQMTLQARKSKVITRLGNQIHSHTHYRTTAAAIQNGAIGKVKEVHSWCSTTGHGKSFHIDRPTDPVEAPKTVDWDKWIGVAPMRPFGKWRVYHPWGWRDFQDFGNGALGDFGCHILDPVFTALNIKGAPSEFTADHIGMNDEVWPAQTTVSYKFPGTEYTTDKDLVITWNDGGRLPKTKGPHLPSNEAFSSSGSLFIGETGSLVIPHVAAPRLYEGKAFETLPSLNHYHGWVDGCLTGKQPSDGLDYGGPLTEAVLLGNIAVRYRTEKLTWDNDAMKITNNKDANKWVRREYRDGWDIKPVS